MLYKLSYKIMDQLISLLNELSSEFQIVTVLYEKKGFLSTGCFESILPTHEVTTEFSKKFHSLKNFTSIPAYHAKILAYVPICQKFEPYPTPITDDPVYLVLSRLTRQFQLGHISQHFFSQLAREGSGSLDALPVLSLHSEAGRAGRGGFGRAFLVS